MTSYVAFLRGINVNGKNIKMNEVISVLQQEEMMNIQSVLATGNIIFHSTKSPDQLKTLLQKALTAYFDFDIHLFIKTKEEIYTIYHRCPFENKNEMHVYVLVTDSGVEEEILTHYENLDKNNDETVVVIDHTIYWQVPKGKTLESNFGKILARKNLKKLFTSRNINTFDKILKKL